MKVNKLHFIVDAKHHHHHDKAGVECPSCYHRQFAHNGRNRDGSIPKLADFQSKDSREGHRYLPQKKLLSCDPLEIPAGRQMRENVRGISHIFRAKEDPSHAS